MDVFEAIKGRRSIRKFKPDSVDEKDLEKILDAGRLAPSAGNCQSAEFIVVRDKAVKKELTLAAHGQGTVGGAPVVIVVCANVPRVSKSYGERGEVLYCVQDTAAAVQNMLLAAHAMGYGTCWVGAFDEEKAAKAVKTPSDVRPLAMIPIGRPTEQPKPTSRLPLEKIVRENVY